MKRLALALLALLTTAGAVVLMSASTGQLSPAASYGQPAATSPAPVVVELFTSEGCSSCPAADAALRELEAAQSVPGVEVLALGQHVDYWNRLGWQDLFSSAQFTQRQRWYAEGFRAGNYTPQAVVNGRYELVGSQRATLAAAVAKAAAAPRATVGLARAANGALRVTVGPLPAGSQASTVQLALTESGLSTKVGRGENSGRLLQHCSVVRALRPLGQVAADGTFDATVPLHLDAGWQASKLRAVVLVQKNSSRHVLGAASLPLRELE